MNKLNLGIRLRLIINIDEVALKPKADLLKGEEVAMIAVEEESTSSMVMMMMKMMIMKMISVQLCHVVVV
ncbi:unnamed protein product [Taenia asiatica]|uniref:Pyruvate kinase n=1 Tax=Taenia asiatica TaxID=60517 RepID=A0A0R3WGA8_TAEAS|nr:unnamed protein product [Taenia asiatica]